LHLEAFGGAFNGVYITPAAISRCSRSCVSSTTARADAVERRGSSEPASSSAGDLVAHRADGGSMRRVATGEHHVGASRRQRRLSQTDPGRRR
jgi:hypothetical protein